MELGARFLQADVAEESGIVALFDAARSAFGKRGYPRQ